MSTDKSEKKRIWSWALYDWANSSFSTTIMAGFFPVFFKTYWSHGVDPTISTARLGTTISIGSALLAFASPTLGALADRRNIKKKMTLMCMLFGIAGCLWMSTIDSGAWVYACFAYGIAMLGFNSSCVFYDSLLPSVAPTKKLDFASSLGFSLGYLGGGILFAFNVLMYLKPNLFGLASGVEAVKWSFASVGLWWGLFSIPLFMNVPEPIGGHKTTTLWEETVDSVKSILQTVRSMYRTNRNLFIFLIAFWLYIDGVYTVMTMAVDFGISIGLKPTDLIAALLIVQFIGFPTALVFSKFANWWGCRKPILICIVIYALGVMGAAHMSTATHFYALAIMIGCVQGGVQALSRSLYSKMIPPEASGEYFGLFNLVGKFASIFGPLLVSWGAYLSGDNRQGMLGLLALFLVGGYLLSRVNEAKI